MSDCPINRGIDKGFRFYADFVGGDPRYRGPRNPSEAQRLLEEQAEFNFGPVLDTVIFSEENIMDRSNELVSKVTELVPANDGPTLVGFDASTEDGLSIVYGRFSDGTVRIFDELDTLPVPANDFVDAIGLSGFAQTGKTAVANYIESKYGYRRQHIAEPLRDMLRTLLRRFDYPDELIDCYLTGELKEELVPCLGVTSRQAQISLGTEWGREQIDQDLWARLWAYEAAQHGSAVMNDSVRFRNEEAAIQEELMGFTIMIQRPGTGPVAYIGWKWLSRKLYQWFGCMWGVHPSERVDLLDPDYVVVNNGTLEQLYDQIDGIMAQEGIQSCEA